MQTILRYLEGLRRSLDGDDLHGMIARILRRHSRSGPIGTTCFVELHYRLEVFAHDSITTPATRIKARLLQQHIAPYLPDNDLSAAVETVADDTDALPLVERRQQLEAMQRSEQDAWRAIYDVVEDFNALKTMWSESFEQMSLERQRLQQKLDDTEQTLQLVEQSCRQLRTDLDSAQHAPARKPARRLGRLTRNASPRLVTRDIFLQQLQAEVSRVKRSGSAAALALLGVDNLDAVTRLLGDGADSAVLSCYVREILSGFRAYDIVGRYDAEVFAVLLPDTGHDGAVRALEKAQKRASETHAGHAGRRFPLPGFCGALSVYVAGEESALWLQRAEGALEQARQQDGERLIVA